MPNSSDATSVANKSHSINHYTGLQKLLEDGLFADLTIICGEERILVHKAILCAQSSFFRSACTLDMQEKKEGVIRLNDDVNVIRCFIDFCYGGIYDKDKRSEGVSEVLHHAMVYMTAIFFDSHDLQALATERFTSAGEAKEVVWTTTDKNSLEIIRCVFCNTSSRTDPLRTALLTLLQERNLDMGDEAALYKLIAEVPDFGAAYMTFNVPKAKATGQKYESLCQTYETLLARVKDEVRDTRCYRCMSCTFVFRIPSALANKASCPNCAQSRCYLQLDPLAGFRNA